jgi:oligopeptide transport system substrate-binding protein
MDEAAATGGNPEERFGLLAEAEKVLVDQLGNMPLLFYSYHNLISARISGFEDNVMDVHPSRFISKEG